MAGYIPILFAKALPARPIPNCVLYGGKTLLTFNFDWKFNDALMLHTALDYQHTWNRNIKDTNYRDSLQLTSGLVLNMGNW